MKKLLEIVTAVVLLLMLLITVGQIVFRSILRISASWSEELAMYTFAFLVFVGAVALTEEDRHITITALTDRLSPAAQRALRVVARLVAVPFMVLFSYGAFVNTQGTWQNSLPTAEWMKIGYMYLVLLISGLLITYTLVANSIKDLLQLRRRAPGDAA